MYMYIYIYIKTWQEPPKAHWLRTNGVNTSGAGLQFLPLSRLAKAHVKGLFLFRDTGMPCRPMPCLAHIRPHFRE